MILRTEYGWDMPATNPGDLIVELGAERLAMFLGLNLEASDTVYLIGTPWFWKGCWNSEKWEWLRSMRAVHADKRWVAIGVGSCFALEETAHHALAADSTLRRAAEYWIEAFDVTITRDQRASSLLRAFPRAPRNLASLPCPSLWSTPTNAPQRPRSVLAIACPPWHQECVAPPSSWDAGADRWEYGRGLWSRQAVHRMLDWLLSHERIISQRIHCALPVAPWRPVRVVPTDGRVATTRNVDLPEGPDEWSSPLTVRAKMADAELRYRELLCR